MIGASDQISAQMDFYNLLQITLLSAEYAYSLGESFRASLSFYESDLQLLQEDRELASQVQELLKAKIPFNNLALMPYIVSEEEGKHQSESFNASAMLWGKTIGNYTDDILVRSREGTRYFYRHTGERSSFNKSLLQFIFANKDITKYRTRLVENVSMEYEVSEEQRDTSFKDLLLKTPIHASIRFSKEFTSKKNYRMYRKDAYQFASNYPSLDPRIIEGIDNQTLRAPFAINVHSQVGPNGIVNLLTANPITLIRAFTLICAGKVQDWTHDLKNRQKRCVEDLKEKYGDVRSDYAEGNRLSLWKLRHFLQEVSDRSDNMQALKILFGSDNVHIAGTFESLTEDKVPFKTYFRCALTKGWVLLKTT